MYQQLTKPISNKKPGGNDIKDSINYIQLRNKYNELISQLSISNDINMNILNSIEQEAYKILTTDSKDLDILNILSTIWTIKYSIKGIHYVYTIIHDYIKNNWEHIYPSIVEEDYTEKRANIIKKIHKHLHLAIFLSHKLQLYDKTKEADIFHLIISIINKEHANNINKEKELLQHNKEMLKTIKEYIDDIVFLSSEIYEEINKNTSSNDNLISDISDSDIYRTLLAIRNLIANKPSKFTKEKDKKTDSKDKSNDKELIEQITCCTHKLVESSTHKLLAHTILYIIQELNVDSLTLTLNLRKSRLLQSLIDEIITKVYGNTENKSDEDSGYE